MQLNNILITTKLLFFLASAELVTENTEKSEPSCKEWIDENCQYFKTV